MKRLEFTKQLLNFKQIAGFVILFISQAGCDVAPSDEKAQGGSHWDRRKVESAKKIFTFAEHEKTAPHYRNAVTNWNPVLRPSNDAYKFNLINQSEISRSYQGFIGLPNLTNAINIKIYYFATSRKAHEYMIEILSTTPFPNMLKADRETTDPSKKIGSRCFRTRSSIFFIRNNILINLDGPLVEIDAIARDLDRQIVELSDAVGSAEPRPPPTVLAGPGA